MTLDDLGGDTSIAAGLHREGELSRSDQAVRMAITDLIPTDLPPGVGALSVRDVMHQIVPTTTFVKHRLRFDDDQMLMIEQLISLDGYPLFHTIGYSPLDSADSVKRVLAELGRHPRSLSLLGVFERMFGVPLGRIESHVEATRTDARITRLLQIKPTTATLVRQLALYDIHNRPRSYNFTHFRADRIRLDAVSA